MNPFGPCAGLAEPAPRHHQPHPPAVARRRQLAIVGPELEPSVEAQQLFGRQRRDSRALFLRRQLLQQPPHLQREHPQPRPSVASSSLSSRSRFLASFARILSRTSSASSSNSMLSIEAAVSECRLSSAIASWFGYSRMCFSVPPEGTRLTIPFIDR